MGTVRQTKQVVLLFDGDILVYRAGFAAEKRVYTVKGNTFSSATHARDFAKAQGIPQSSVTWERNPEPVENAIHNVYKIIARTQSQIVNDYNLRIQDGDTINEVVFLTGCGSMQNFRELHAHEYKANRDPAHKPTHYDALRTHIQKTWPTVITEGAETDDYLCQAAKDVKTKFERPGHTVHPIIVSIDKDLLSVPGTHYNFVNGALLEVTENDADYNFFKQMLVGDTADNVKGIKGIGAARATTILHQHFGNPHALCAAALAMYASREGANWLQRWNDNAIMLYIWRQVPDICPWIFPSKKSAEDFLKEHRV